MRKQERKKGGMGTCRFLLVAVLVFSLSVVGSLCFNDNSDQSIRDKPAAMMTFEMENGDIVDCVDIYKQPAFDHPSMKDHQIQEPTSMPHDVVDVSPRQEQMVDADLDRVDCPIGTIPIMRTTLNKKATRETSPPPLHLFENLPPEQCPPVYYWCYHATEVGKYYGGVSRFSIHPVLHVYPNQTSGALLVLSNAKNGPQNAVLTVGWIVNHQLYSDYGSRLSLYWQANGRGCWNTVCPGYVQVSRKYYPGARFRNISTMGGEQFSSYFTIYKERSGSNQYWWFVYGMSREVMGYWMNPVLGDSAAQVIAGGYISTPRFLFSPTMGSGRWDSEGFKWAAFASCIGIVNDKNTIVKPTNFNKWVSTDKRFYGLGKLQDDSRPMWGLHFFYGGPGGYLVPCVKQ